MQLIIPNVFDLNGRTIKEFDLIEIYYDSAGSKLKFISAQYWRGNELTFSLPQNNDALNWGNGFNENDPIYIKIFDETANCRTELSLTTNLGNGVFRPGTVQTATKLEGSLTKFSYLSDTICNGIQYIQAEGISHPYTLESLQFGSNVSGLDLGTGGSIDYSKSLPGDYIVEVTSKLCMENSGRIPVVILPQISLKSEDFILANNDCSLKNGSISIKKPLQETYALYKNDNPFPIALGAFFDTLTEGTYSIRVKTRNGCSATSPNLNIVCNPIIDGMLLFIPSDAYTTLDNTISIKDSVQLFFDSAGVKKILVASQLYNSAKALRFFLPRNTSLNGKNGFKAGDTLYIKIKDFARNCFLDNIRLLSQTAPILFVDKTIAFADQVTGFIPSFSYSNPNLCSDASTITSGRGTGSRAIRIKYNYTSTFGLNLDNNTGIVNWTGSVPGSYLVNINTTSCLTSYIMPITIHKPISISANELQITQPDCGQNNGAAELSGNILNGSPPFTYVFSKSGIEIPNKTENSIGDLEAGNYDVTVFDKNRCQTGFNFEVKCNQQVEDVVHLSPNHILSSANPKYAEVKIPCDQAIRIVNRSGRIVKNLSANSIWNGTDDTNSELPNGLYIVYCGEKKIGEVTILR